MPARHNIFVQGQYYHIYNRGVGKQNIFFNPGNYLYLIRLIAHYSNKYSISIIAYCLMPNHYHFLLRQNTDLPISKFINVLFITYVQGLNREQQRKGTLFESRFKQRCIEQSTHLIHLCRYIHNNPRKAGLVDNLDDWPYSNYLDWIGLRDGKLLDRSFIVTNFPDIESYKKFVDDLQDSLEAEKKLASYLLD